MAGQLAREVADAAPRPVWVAGSVPPVCGSYRADLFDVAVARPLVEVLVTALRPSVDLWLGETLSAIEEAQLLADVIGSDGKPLWLSFTLSDDGTYNDVPRLRSGETVAQAVEAALRLNAASVLFNCSQPEVMAAELEKLFHDPAARAAQIEAMNEFGRRLGEEDASPSQRAARVLLDFIK